MSFNVQGLGLDSSPDYEVELADAFATRALGAALGALLERGDFLGLIGHLGAGKTTLVQGLVDAIEEGMEATSPTYGLLHIYETAVPVFHVDLYRLQTIDDLESMGYWDYAEADEGILCVEWLDRIPEAWPGQGFVLELAHHQGRRRARLWASAQHKERIAALG